MKINNACTSSLSWLVLCAFVFSTFSSCRKNKKCDLTVTVTSANNNIPVAGATVHVYPNQAHANGNLKDQDQTITTDGTGVARFTFKLPAILETNVTSAQGTATKIVQLEEGKSVNLAVKVF